MEYERLQNAIVFRNAFTDLSEFIANQKEKPLKDSGVINSEIKGYNKDFRYSKQVTVDTMNPVVRRVRNLCREGNEKFFKINISAYSIENHFVEYEIGGKFRPHSDIIWPTEVDNLNTKPTRKLTSVTLLNDDFTGGKLALWYTGKRYSFSFNAGDMILFPSFIEHTVDPVETGIRYSLVSWSYGEF